MQICWGGTLKKCTWFRLIVRAAALRGSEGRKDVIVIGLLQEPTATVFENYPIGRIQIARKASYVYFLSEQKFIKIAKKGQFGEFGDFLITRSNSVTKQKIGR